MNDFCCVKLRVYTEPGRKQREEKTNLGWYLTRTGTQCVHMRLVVHPNTEDRGQDIDRSEYVISFVFASSTATAMATPRVRAQSSPPFEDLASTGIRSASIDLQGSPVNGLWPKDGAG